PNADGEPITPSVVFFEGPDRIVVGREARQALSTDPDRTVAFVKREMGVATYHLEVDGRSYTAEEVSSFILRKLASDAARQLGEEVTDVVITCPAYFGSAERAATRNAGELAGLKVHQVLNEPTAAAISYGLTVDRDQTLLVYDLGGGTFDVTVITVRSGDIEVVATGGDFRLGGKDWDDVMLEYLAERFQEQCPGFGDPRDDPETMGQLMLAADEAKRSLSSRESTRVLVACGGGRARVEVTRAVFEERTAPLVERTLELTWRVLGEARERGVAALDQVLLVGGSSRMPAVSARLRELLGVEPRLYEPDLAVARGAALWGLTLLAGDLVRLEVARSEGIAPEAVRLESVAGPVLTRAAEEVAREHPALCLPGREVERAARCRVVNVASKGFGVVARNREGRDEVCYLVRKNAPLPAESSRTFGTNDAGQREVILKVMEQAGERESPHPAHNRLLGEGVIRDIPRLPAGSPIHVRFRLGQDGTLSVQAAEPSSGKRLAMSLRVDGILSDAEVEARRGGLLRMAVS
ncbi:MAG: Hsp70 family protein, partial [Candidatus Eremiobacterota bacterium]